MQIEQGRLRFGIHSGQPHTTLDEDLELWRFAEQLGLDWASVFDHFLPRPPADRPTIERFAREVAPALRAA
jgi:hypothetical protein